MLTQLGIGLFEPAIWVSAKDYTQGVDITTVHQPERIVRYAAIP
jgi:hypothetical protein